ncbi:MAG TPA: transcription elongation factor GreA [Longimicrobiales bacterium]|nr:transcription elongation factor GreA [Longimicrobiales bacterium]
MLEATKQKIADEIERLTHELRVVLPAAIQKAVELGDLSENAEYSSALERQQFVQARLNHLRQRMSELSRIDVSAMPLDRIGFGSRVKLVELDTGAVVEYTITAGDYIDLDAGEISLASPIGQALLGKALEEEVTVQLPRGARRYRVVELTTLPQMLR